MVDAFIAAIVFIKLSSMQYVLCSMQCTSM